MLKSIDFIAVALAGITFICPVCSHARTPEQVKAEMNQAVDIVVSTYDAGGMSGLINLTSDCYDKTNNNEFICIYIDLASRYIDQNASETLALSPTEFFQDAHFGYRIAGVFKKMGMERKKSNKYLQMATPEIDKMIDNKFSK